MFEITYNDSDTLQNFIDADKAYHGAIYDFTFEGRFIVYHFFCQRHRTVCRPGQHDGIRLRDYPQKKKTISSIPAVITA